MTRPEATTEVGRPDKLEALVNGLRSHLDQAYRDTSLPVEVRKIEGLIGAKKSTIYVWSKKDARVAALLVEMRALRDARAAARQSVQNAIEAAAPRKPPATMAPRNAAATSALPKLDLVRISEQYEQVKDKAVWVMQRFAGRHRMHGHVSDLPRVAYELENALSELHGVLNQVKSLSDAWHRLHLKQDAMPRTRA